MAQTRGLRRRIEPDPSIRCPSIHHAQPPTSIVRPPSCFRILESEIALKKAVLRKTHKSVILNPVNAAFTSLPDLLSQENAVSLELQEGTIILRASTAVKDRIEHLVEKEKTVGLTPDEKKELDGFEEIDYYLSHVNRLIRNSNISGEMPLAS